MNDLYTLIAEIKEDIGHLKGTSEATLEQAKKTNGRLLEAEKQLAELNTFKTQITTMMTSYAKVGTIIGTIVSTIGAFALNKFL